MIQSFKKSRGFTLVEALIYFSILLVVSVAVVLMFLSYSAILHDLRVRVLMSETAQSTLERVTREIRNADAVDPFNTLVDNPSGILTLTNIYEDDVRLALNSGAIEIAVGAESATPITSSLVTVEEFRVYRYINSSTELVRVSFTLSASTSKNFITETFHSGAVLRGSYD